MKKRVVALLCTLSLSLTGCSSLLNREYFSSTPHTDYPISDRATVIQADNYQGLVNAILYFVTEHKDSGIVHLTYAREDDRVASALDAACHEVRDEDPLAAYAVEDIQYAFERMAAYYEVDITISYAHTVDEVAAIVPLAGSSAIRQTVSAAMTSFADKCIFRVSYFTGDVASLRQMVRQTWLDTPLALAKPNIGIMLYPDSGTSRIVEISLTWPEEVQMLAEESATLEQRALELLENAALPPEELTPQSLLSALKRAAFYDPEGESTAYAVLVEGQGDSLGFAQALRLLCQLTDLEATVTEGRYSGEKQFWLIVNTPDGYRHLDPTMVQPDYATDDVFSEAGYTWDTGHYPPCVEYTPPAEPENSDTPEEPQEGGEPGAGETQDASEGEAEGDGG